jgi:phosphate transport system permease protein
MVSPKDAIKAVGLDRRASRNASESAIGMILLICASISIITTIGVIYSISSETLQFFLHPEVTLREFFTETRWTPLFAGNERHFGIAPLITGTLLVTLIALVVGIPLGLGAAIYLSEFANAATRRSVMPILEVLAGVPTVVLGYFAVLYVTPVLKEIIPGVSTFNSLSAGLVMGFMVMPTISSISIDAMQAVPLKLREAAYGLGATRAEVTLKVVFPAALSGIVAAIILAMSRAIGETMVVALAAGQRPTLTFDPRETISTMTAFIVQAATGDQPAGSIGSQSLYAVAAMLFLITLILNIVSQQIVRKFAEKYE